MNAAGSAAIGIRVEFVYDPESQNWHFSVPSLGIVGGADSRDAARRMARDAILFTLDASSEDAADATGADVEYIEVMVSAG
jgi:predicted RNase H-like HicB family nuclease